MHGETKGSMLASDSTSLRPWLEEAVMIDMQDARLAVQHDHPQTYEGHCPTCGQFTIFSFLGEQHWPPRLVEATGCPPVTILWTCNSCHTTVSDTDINS